MKSTLLEKAASRILRTLPRGLGERAYGGGVYDERYSPESREDFVKAYVNRVWVQRCINLKANSVDQVDLEVKIKGEWYDLEALQEQTRPGNQGKRLLELLDRPTSRDPSTTFLSWSVKWGEIIGDWLWEIIPAADNSIAELFPLRPYSMRIRDADSESDTGGFRYWPEGAGNFVDYEAVDYEPNKVPAVTGTDDNPVALFGRYPSPIDEYYGMPPLRGAKDDVISEYYAVRYDHRFFRNSARPDIVVGFKQRLDVEQRAQNKEEWQNFKSVDNAHRAAILDGDPSVHLLSQNPRDIEYLDGRKLSREGQCGAFGVPPVLVGILDRATYSNYAEAKIIFWTETMIPLLDFFISWAKWTLLPFFPDIEDIRHRADKIPAVQEAEKYRSDRIIQEIEWGLSTPNEGREELGRDKVDAPEADQLHLQVRLVPLGSPASAGEAAPGVILPGTPGYVDPNAAVNGNGNGNGAVPAPVPPPAEPKKKVPASWKDAPDGIQAWLRQHDLLIERFSQRALTELQRHFSDQRSAVMKLIADADKAQPGDLEAAVGAHDWDADEKKLIKIVNAMVYGMSEEAIQLTNLLMSDTDLKQDELDPLVDKVLKQVMDRPDGIQQVSKRVKTDVTDQIREGLSHGLTHRDIATGGTFDVGPAGARDSVKVTIKGVQGVYEEYTTWQAERIARTEAGMAFNLASGTLMQDAGIEYVDIVDGDEDLDCSMANGARWTVDEYMTDPMAHPNCTRVGLPVINVPATT